GILEETRRHGSDCPDVKSRAGTETAWRGSEFPMPAGVYSARIAMSARRADGEVALITGGTWSLGREILWSLRRDGAAAGPEPLPGPGRGRANGSPGAARAAFGAGSRSSSRTRRRRSPRSGPRGDACPFSPVGSSVLRPASPRPRSRLRPGMLNLPVDL